MALNYVQICLLDAVLYPAVLMNFRHYFPHVSLDLGDTPAMRVMHKMLFRGWMRSLNIVAGGEITFTRVP